MSTSTTASADKQRARHVQTPAPDRRHAQTIGRYGFRLRRFTGLQHHAERLDKPIRIAHLTDLHCGKVTPFKVQMEAVAIANSQRPDLVVLTGDFVCHSHAYLDQLTEVVESFNAPVLAVMGNHDYWAGAAEVRRALIKGGAELLDNANTVLTLGGQRLQVVGLDDAYTGHADRAKAIRGMDLRLPTLGLSHIAEEADGLWHYGVPLVLSGHTHAGQLSVARLNELMIGRVAGHRYVHGLYGAGAGGDEPIVTSPANGVYVGAGVGAAVMPVRLGDRGNREVTIFELGARPGSIAVHHDAQVVTPVALSDDERAERRAAYARYEVRRGAMDRLHRKLERFERFKDRLRGAA